MDHQKYKIKYRGKTIAVAFGESNAIFICGELNKEKNGISTIGFFRIEEDIASLKADIEDLQE